MKGNFLPLARPLVAQLFHRGGHTVHLRGTEGAGDNVKKVLSGQLLGCCPGCNGRGSARTGTSRGKKNVRPSGTHSFYLTTVQLLCGFLRILPNASICYTRGPTTATRTDTQDTRSYTTAAGQLLRSFR